MTFIIKEIKSVCNAREMMLVHVLFAVLLLAQNDCMADKKALTLRIATYNVENFYDRYDDPYNSKDSRVDQDTAPKSSRGLWAIAKIIKSINPDIIALQEIENRGFLTEFNRSYLSDLGYKNVVLIEGNSSKTTRGRGIDVAVLSRVPVYSATTYQYFHFPIGENYYGKFSRDLLHVRLRPENFPEINFFVLHSASKRGGAFAHYRRIAEAKSAAKILSDELKNKKDDWVIVAGDFNDTPNSKSLKHYTSIPEIPLTRVPAFDAKQKQHTYYGKGNSYPPSALDHILVNDAAKNKLVSPVASIWNDKSAAIASDHRPVYITLQN